MSIDARSNRLLRENLGMRRKLRERADEIDRLRAENEQLNGDLTEEIRYRDVLLGSIDRMGKREEAIRAILDRVEMVYAEDDSGQRLASLDQMPCDVTDCDQPATFVDSFTDLGGEVYLCRKHMRP